MTIELARVFLPAPSPRGQLNPYDAYLRSLSSEESERAMRGCLDRIAALLLGQAELPEHPGRLVPWGQLRYSDTTTIRARLTSTQPPLSPAYVNKHLSALRRVLKEAWRLGYMTAEDYHRARDITNVKGERLPIGRNIATAETVTLLDVCAADDSPAGLRDVALVALLHSTGGRRAEAAAARIEHYDPGTRKLTIIGKGNKQRAVRIHEPAAVYIGRWIATLGSRGPLLRPIDRWGNISDRALSPTAIAQIIERRRAQAGLPALSPHDFRRTFIGDLLDTGADLATAQALAGHASPVTTARYDRRADQVKATAVDRVGDLLPMPDASNQPL